MDKIFKIKGQQVVTTLAGNPNNPPIILIHGWGSHRGVWRQTIPALQEKYYCVSVDLLGFGGSDKPEDGDYSLPMQGARIVYIAEQLGFKRFSLIGHSMGGQIAFHIAAMLAPERVDKLVSVSGVVTGELSERVLKVNFRMVSLGRKWRFLYGVARSLLNFRPFANYVFCPWFLDMNNPPFESWEIDRTNTINPACAVSLDEAGKAIRVLDSSKYLHKIKAHTLLIHGQQDGTVPVDQAILAQTIIPDNDLALIEKCGHFPMYEKTRNYLKALALIFPNT
jgi:pimeloyl-ACP methyl ester carboxylesterase